MISDQTEHYVTDTCGEDNAEHWRALCGALNADLIKLRDVHNRQSAEATQDKRNTEVRVRREVWDAVTGFQRWQIVTEARQPLNNLVWRAGRLADKPKIDDIRALRIAADHARHAIEQAAKQPPGVLAELARLRRAVRTAGEFLHTRDGFNTGERCACLGCELARMAEEPS